MKSKVELNLLIEKSCYISIDRSDSTYETNDLQIEDAEMKFYFEKIRIRQEIYFLFFRFEDDD